MSCMSEMCSLFSEFPTGRELKWSFCSYFQKNKIIIVRTDPQEEQKYVANGLGQILVCFFNAYFNSFP